MQGITGGTTESYRVCTKRDHPGLIPMSALMDALLDERHVLLRPRELVSAPN
jgi:hypothetical protein